MIKNTVLVITTFLLLSTIAIPFSDDSLVSPASPARAQGTVDSDDLAKFVALVQYIRSQPTPADVKVNNIPLLSSLDVALSDIYITGFITPYTGETSDQVKARLQSVPVEDRFTAVMVESYRLSPDPLLLDIVHQLLPLYYVQFFTTAEDLNASDEFLKRDGIESLADAFDSTGYAIPAPSVTQTPGTASPSTRGPSNVDSDDLAKFVAVMRYIRSKPTPSDVKANNIPLLSTLDTSLSDIYITGFITPYTGETSDQVKARLQSVPVEDRFTAVMVESYRLSPNPLLLDIVHQLLPLYYVQFFTTAEDLNASDKFLRRDDIASLAAAFNSTGYAIPAPTGGPPLTPTPTAAATPTQTVGPAPNLRHIDQKRYMLELINTERAKAGLNSVVLGDNIAAQLHAESALKNCFSSHWGIDGLKPYMRYSLAGGYQSNGENGSGRDYCIKASDGYRAIQNINTEISKVMEGWMDSPGHRRNILDKWHKRVNMGLAWDRYNISFYQHFEGDYTKYDQLPTIQDGILTIEGRTKNGVTFAENRDLNISIHYDPPPHTITRGQVTRTYCYDNGLRIASLRWPLTGGAYWPTNGYTTTYKPCPSPYDVPANAPGPRSVDEAHQFWQDAYDASQMRTEQVVRVPWITSSKWLASGDVFSVETDVTSLLTKHGDGVYTLIIWGKIADEYVVISQYSVFLGVTSPDTYSIESVSTQDTTAATPTATSMSAATPTVTASPTPTTTDWRWDRWKPDDGNWSISIPPGWTFNEDYSDEAYSQFGDDELAIVDVSVTPNLPSKGILGLDGYARAWKSATESWGTENHPTTFNVTSFEKKSDRGGRKFYSLEYEYYFASIGCWIYGIDHIFTDIDYGAVVSGSICDLDGIVSDEDWGDIPEILDSFELHRLHTDIYRNNLYGYSLEPGLGYNLYEDTEEHNFSFFWGGYVGLSRVAYISVGTFKAREGSEYALKDFATVHREFLISYAEEQGWPLFQVKSLTKHSETSPFDGATRQWYEFTYREQISTSSCVKDVTELIIMEDSKDRGETAYVVTGAVCEGYLDNWGPRRDAALNSFRP